MALEKTHIIKGFEVKYWHISELRYMKHLGITEVTVVGYQSKESRLASLENFFPGSQLPYTLQGKFTTEDEIYPLLKLPIIQRQLINHGSPETVDAEGNVIPAVPDEFLEIDTNALTGAADI